MAATCLWVTALALTICLSLGSMPIGCLGLGYEPMGGALGLGCCMPMRGCLGLDGMPWPMGCLGHGCMLMGACLDLGYMSSLGNMPMGLPCPWLHAYGLGYCMPWPWVLHSHGGCLGLGCLPLGLPWPWLHAWPWWHAHRGLPRPWLLHVMALGWCMPTGCCLGLGCMP